MAVNACFCEGERRAFFFDDAASAADVGYVSRKYFFERKRKKKTSKYTHTHRQTHRPTCCCCCLWWCLDWIFWTRLTSKVDGFLLFCHSVVGVRETNCFFFFECGDGVAEGLGTFFVSIFRDPKMKCFSFCWRSLTKKNKRFFDDVNGCCCCCCCCISTEFRGRWMSVSSSEVGDRSLNHAVRQQKEAGRIQLHRTVCFLFFCFHLISFRFVSIFRFAGSTGFRMVFRCR